MQQQSGSITLVKRSELSFGSAEDISTRLGTKDDLQFKKSNGVTR